MQEQSPPRDQNLVSLWEKMGASTGALLGKTIGQMAQYGLDVYEQMVVNPLKQSSPSSGAATPDTGMPSGIRQETWREMGKEYGETIGSSIGLAMDMLINSLKVSLDEIAPGINREDNRGNKN